MALAHDQHAYDNDVRVPGITVVVAGTGQSIHDEDYPRTDLAQHKATWAGVVHFAKWFSLHLVVDMFGLVMLLLGHRAIGFPIIAIGTAVFAYGILSTPAAARRARDEARALAHIPLPVDAEARVI